jgi:hypothetical protein
MRGDRTLLAAAVLTATGLHAQDGTGLKLVGSAQLLNDRLRLTPAERQMVGAAWYLEKQFVAGGFVTSFRFQITNRGGLGPGADGFAFVLQNSGNDAIAGPGSAGGFALGGGWRDPQQPGIPRSLAVFFDTFQNGDGHDPSDNYIAICTNGAIPKMRWPPPRLGVATRLPFRLKDGKVHAVRIRYKPPLLLVSLDDGEPLLHVPVDLSPVLDAGGNAYVGFTASTGNGFENHDILLWSLRPEVESTIAVVESNIQFLNITCLEGRNLCTPKEASVEERRPGEYHVVLPAHLEWGASVPNRSGRPVSISNARGTVCWDLKMRGDEGCSGPEGAGIANKEFVRPDRQAGALVMKTGHGRTWFSVNDRSRGFGDNQGYFEFEVRVP